MVEKLLLEKSKQGIAMIELIFALVIMGIVLMSAPMLIQQSIKSGNVALQQEAIAAAAAHTSMILSLHWDESNTKYQGGISPILLTEINLGAGAAGGAGGAGAAGQHPDFLCNLMPNLPICQNNNASNNDKQNTWLKENRAGLVGVTGRNMLDANNTLLLASTTLQEDADDNILDDVDDYNDKDVNLTVFNSEGSSADKGDYVDVDLKISTEVYYANDTITLNATDKTINNTFATNAGQSTNIKFINVNLTSTSGIEELDKNITMKAFSCNIGTTVPQDGGEV